MSRRWLHVLTSDEVFASPGFMARAEEVIQHLGSDGVFHIRTRLFTARQYVVIVQRLLEVSRKVEGSIIVNERVDVALAAGADGVQLGRGALSASDVRRIAPGLKIGLSVHSSVEARQEAGVDWLLFGHLFETRSHPDAGPVGLAALREVIERSQVPVVAVGGITPEVVGQVLAAGAVGVAVLSSIWREDSPKQAISRYLSTNANR